MNKQSLLEEVYETMQVLKKSPQWDKIEKENEELLAIADAQRGMITEELLEKFYEKAAGVCAVYRKEDKMPDGRRVPAASEINHFMKHYMSQMQLSKQMFHPIEYAAICHKRFLEICPFEKYNEEVAQLVLNYLLVQSGYIQVDIKAENTKNYEQVLKAAQHPSSPDFDGLTVLIGECLLREEKRLLNV